MQGWTIRKQISALSGVSIGFLLLVAAVSAGAVYFLNASFGGFKSATERSARLNLILEDLIEANVAATAFEYTGDVSYTERVDFEIADILQVAAIDDIVRRSTPEFDALMGEITSATDRYAAVFERLEVVKNEQTNLKTELIDTSAIAREALAALSERAAFDNIGAGLRQISTATQYFFLSTLYYSRYLNQGAETHLSLYTDQRETALIALDRAERLLNADRFGDLIEASRTAIEDYYKAADRMSALNADRDERVENLQSASLALSGLVEDAVDTASDQQAEIWRENRQAAFAMGIAQALVIAAALAILILAARRISSQIRSDIRGAIDDMSALAEGNLDLEIFGLEHDTEIGEMARSLEVFRQNALEAKRIEEELKRSEAEAEREKERKEEADRQREIEQREQRERERQAIMEELSTVLGSVVNAAASGDFSHRIESRFGQQALDDIAQSVNALVESVEASITETARVLRSIADGDLTDRMTGTHKGIFATLQATIHETTETLSDVMRGIVQQSAQIDHSARQMEQQADDLSARAETQAAALEETSAAMKEMSTSVREGAEAAKNSSKIASDATERVNEAGQVVEASVSAMTDIKEASEKIKDIVAVMDSIAYQTNLLALNASVEAARAGEAGKGFAVVATEVRALAQRSGDASKDIKGLIEEAVSQVVRGVGLVEQTGATLSEVVDAVLAMSNTMDGLTVRAQDQAAGVSEVARAVDQMDTVTQKNAMLADESREAARALAEKMAVMQEMVARFRTEVETNAQSHPIAAE